MAERDDNREEVQMRDIEDGEMGASEVETVGVDVYITQYAAKPMEQLQNLVTQCALGFRRLEVQEEHAALSDREAKHPPAAVGSLQGACKDTMDAETCSLRSILKLQSGGAGR